MERTGYSWNIKNNKNHWWFLARNNIIQRILQNLFSDRKDLKILDVGCGSGLNLSMLRKFGTVSGIEPDDEIRKYAQENNPNCTIYKGALPNDNPVQNERFDLIVALDVIEHIKDDLESCKQLKNMLMDCGRIIITVPAFEILFSKSDKIACHYRRYNKNTLSKLLIKTGFTKFNIYYFNTFLFLPIAIIKLWEKFFPSETLVEERDNSFFLNKVLYHIMSLEKYTLKFNFIGISLCAVIEK